MTKFLRNLDAALQTIYKLLLMELKVSYFIIYVINRLFCLFFKICFEDVH